MEDRWAPFSVRQNGEPDAWHVLHEGVPRHLHVSLLRVVGQRFGKAPGAAEVVQRRLRLDLSVSSGPVSTHLLTMASANDEVLLNVADCLLDHARGAWFRSKNDPGNMNYSQNELTRQDIVEYVTQLREVLDEADSAYTVEVSDEDGPWQLARRVDETATAAATDVTARQAPASALLAASWAATFRRTPDLKAAYRDSVLAVESVACGLFTPKDPSPSLGKAIAHLESTLTRWSVAGLDDKRQQSAFTLLGMLQTVWQNHERHVGQGGRPPQPVQQAEAEAVLFLAITLVQWFDRGLVQRVDTTK